MSIARALEYADDAGDTIVVAAGTYTLPLDIRSDGLTITGAFDPDHIGEVRLDFDGEGILVYSDQVTLSGLTITGGDGLHDAISAVHSEGLQLNDIRIEDYDGNGLVASGVTTTVSLYDGRFERLGGIAVSVERAAAASLHSSRLTGFAQGSTPPVLANVIGEGSTLFMDHTVVYGAWRNCVRSSDGALLDITNSIIGACGVQFGESESDTMTHYAVLSSESSGQISSSIINGSAVRPHEFGVLGELETSSMMWNRYPDFEGWAQRTGVFGISVDDRSNLEKAVALAEVMDARDLHLSFFLNIIYDWNLTESQWDDVRSLAARGHDIGCHAATNARLPQEIPAWISWDGGDDAAWATVSGSGSWFSLSVQNGDTSDKVLGPLSLIESDNSTIGKLCSHIEDVDGFSCELSEEYGSATALYVNASALADGTIDLSAAAETGLLYDMRLPSDGGRKFTVELIQSRAVIEEVLGEGAVRSFAYPGQEHNALVREALADVGYVIARGSGSYSRSDHLLYEPFDIHQTPLTLSVDSVRGPDYEALSVQQQQARVQDFAAGWAAFAMEVGAMGSLTVHDDLTPTELTWLLDEFADTGIEIRSVSEVFDLISAERDESGSLPMPPPHDYALTATSPAIDAGMADHNRTRDAAGRPIYGLPDLGMHEYQPTRSMKTDALPLGIPVRLYDDGRFRNLAPLSSLSSAALSVAPAEGFVETKAPGIRAHLLDLEVVTWTPRLRQWRLLGQQPIVHHVTDLIAGQAYTISITPDGSTPAWDEAQTAIDGTLTFTVDVDEGTTVEIVHDSTDLVP